MIIGCEITYRVTLLARSARYRVNRKKNDCISVSNAYMETSANDRSSGGDNAYLLCLGFLNRGDEPADLVAHRLRSDPSGRCFEIDMACTASTGAERIAPRHQ